MSADKLGPGAGAGIIVAQPPAKGNGKIVMTIVGTFGIDYALMPQGSTGGQAPLEGPPKN